MEDAFWFGTRFNQSIRNATAVYGRRADPVACTNHVYSVRPQQSLSTPLKRVVTHRYQPEHEV